MFEILFGNEIHYPAKRAVSKGTLLMICILVVACGNHFQTNPTIVLSQRFEFIEMKQSQKQRHVIVLWGYSSIITNKYDALLCLKKKGCFATLDATPHVVCIMGEIQVHTTLTFLAFGRCFVGCMSISLVSWVNDNSFMFFLGSIQFEFSVRIEICMF